MAFRNKKGNVLLESTLVIIVLLVMAIFSVVGYKMFDEINNDIQGMSDLDSEAKEEFQHLHTRFPSSMDGIFAVCFGLLWLMVLIASFMINARPVFFVVSLILLICLLFAAGWIANAYEDIEDDPQLSTYAESFPMTSFILGHLMHAIFLIGLSIALVLYGKNRLA